jgi:hypothetical protein
MAMKVQGGRMVPAQSVKTVSDLIYAVEMAGRDVTQAAKLMAAGAASVPADQLQEYQRLARMYVDVFQKSDQVATGLRKMKAQIEGRSW